MLNSSGPIRPGALDLVVSGYLSRGTQSILRILFALPPHYSQSIIYPMSKAASRTFSRSVALHIRSLVCLVVILDDVLVSQRRTCRITLSIHRIRSVDQPSSPLHCIIELHERKLLTLSTLSHPRAIEGDRKKHRDDSWTMRGLRAWLAHVFRLQG